MTDVLKNVVENGTGKNAQLLGRAGGGQDRYHRRATSRPGSSATPRSCRPPIAMFRLDDNEKTKKPQFL